MKKILIILMLAVTVALVLPTAAFASTDKETAITEIAKSNQNIKEAVTIVKDDIAVIAIKTDVITRTQYWALKEKLSQSITEKFADITNVYVTNNPKVFHTLQKLSNMDDKQRQTELEKLMDKLSKIPMPLIDGNDKIPTPYKVGQ